MRVSLQFKILAGFGFSFIMLCLIAVASYRSLSHLTSSNQLVAHTQETIAGLNALEAGIQEIQIAYRTIIILEEPTSDRFTETVVKLNQQLEFVQYLTRDNPRQQQTLQQLSQPLQAYLASFQPLLNQPRTITTNDPQRRVALSAQLTQSHHLRERLGEMKKLENTLLFQRSQAAEAEARQTMGLIVAGNLAGLLVMVGAAFLIRRDLRLRLEVEQKLQRSEERLQLALQSGEVGTWHWDIVNDNLAWSDIFKKMWDVPLSQTIFHYDDFITRVHPEDRPRINQAIQLALQNKQQYQVEYRIVWRNGEIRYIAAQGICLFNPDGKPLRMEGLVQDITRNKLAAQRIEELNRELAARIEELESFSYSVSHDLRTPLRAIDGFSRVVLEQYGATLPPEAQRYLGLVRNGTKRMSNLIDDLLTLSRVTRQQIKRQKIHQTQLVHQCVDEIREAYPDRTIEVNIADLPTCYSDPVLVKQVWTNLLANAFKYTRSQPEAVIQVGFRETPDGAAYFVQDNGIGFDMKYVGKLFGVFQRLHSSEEYEGTGVGLAIVRRIVNRLGGRAW
ncbi:MAG TPA: PAS domain-containing protein, partial [Acidobacteriota bacterium]|nr:PAS domain-containing protein [Acidobacteriota bacterium]